MNDSVNELTNRIWHAMGINHMHQAPRPDHFDDWFEDHYAKHAFDWVTSADSIINQFDGWLKVAHPTVYLAYVDSSYRLSVDDYMAEWAYNQREFIEWVRELCEAEPDEHGKN